MSRLYDVYTKGERGSWGISASADGVWYAEIAKDGALKGKGALAMHRVAAEVAQRARQGYTKLTKPRYLRVLRDGKSGRETAEFVVRHPDLLADGIVCYATMSLQDDPAAIAGELREQLLQAGVPESQFEDGVMQMARAEQYLAAAADHPALVLVLAGWAIDNGRLLVSDLPGVPLKAPKSAPKDWTDWLVANEFKTADVQRALVLLGWSIADQLRTAETEDKSSTDGNWLQASAAVDF